MKIFQYGLFIQIGNFQIWEEIKYIIYNFEINKCLLMININNDIITTNESNLIKNEFPFAIITYSPNKGMDIYGFFKQIEYIINNNITIHNICKIHTKTNDKWRQILINKLCGSKNIIHNNIKLLTGNIGLLCPKEYLINIDHLNNPIIINLLKYWNIENIYVDEINWKIKQKYILGENEIDYFFYITYPYNNFKYSSTLINNKKKLEKFAISHWNNIGSKKFHYVPSSDMVTKQNFNIFTFPAGTMFWIKGEDLKLFFKKYIKFKDFYECFEPGYSNNNSPTLTHSFERIFGLIPIFIKKINLPI